LFFFEVQNFREPFRLHFVAHFPQNMSNQHTETYTHNPQRDEKGSGALGWSTPAYLANENIIVKNVQGKFLFA
jgi:hypothetical protein